MANSLLQQIPEIKELYRDGWNKLVSLEHQLQNYQELFRITSETSASAVETQSGRVILNEETNPPDIDHMSVNSFDE